MIFVFQQFMMCLGVNLFDVILLGVFELLGNVIFFIKLGKFSAIIYQYSLSALYLVTCFFLLSFLESSDTNITSFISFHVLFFF